MPDPALTACLILVVALVATSAAAFLQSHRKDDAMGSLVGLGAMTVAAVPAVAYGAMTSF